MIPYWMSVMCHHCWISLIGGFAGSLTSLERLCCVFSRQPLNGPRYSWKWRSLTWKMHKKCNKRKYFTAEAILWGGEACMSRERARSLVFQNIKQIVGQAVRKVFEWQIGSRWVYVLCLLSSGLVYPNK